jgi:tRNA(fMet)-specific endonuclease VapC
MGRDRDEEPRLALDDRVRAFRCRSEEHQPGAVPAHRNGPDLLDANAVIALLNDTTSPIARRIRRYAPREIGVPAVVIHELYCGAFRSQRVEKNVARVDALRFPVLEFDLEDARQAGEVRAHQASKGTPIGPYDVLIAGQAKARKLTLVTHNTSEFKRVPGLKVEDWKRATPPSPTSSQKSIKPRTGQ